MRIGEDGLNAHRKLVEHIKHAMNLPGGPLLQVFAKTYKDEIKKARPDMDSVKQAEEASKLFDADSTNSREAKYEQAKKTLVSRKAEKKVLMQAKKDKKKNKNAWKNQELLLVMNRMAHIYQMEN